MKKNILVVVVVTLFLVVGCFILFKFPKDKLTLDSTDKIDMDINTDDDDQKIDWENYKINEYILTESLNITSDGIYNLSGTIENGLITINTKGNVKLVLNNVNITNSNGPAILVKNAQDVVIELSDSSNNYLEDSESYKGYEDDEVGTIMSHDDLTIQGTGKLEVVANNEDAIVSKDDLKIISGSYKITSKDDGIRGKDSVYILDGNFDINAGGDGIKTTNDIDENKGFIKIENGSFNIISDNDGIQAETKLLIENGNFNITTGGGSTNSSTKDKWGIWGKNSSLDSSSAKGIKASDNLLIENGVFVLDTSDDAIHCNKYAGIKNGNLSITSGDDGIHADEELIIDGGVIKINKSYEGIEASVITINNATIDVVSSDDGINVAGGVDSSSKGGRPGENNFSRNSNNNLTINGGDISVDASGDGLDANGSIYINGGNITVYGPSNSGNGALDYDNVFEITGGNLLAGGASGMLQGCSTGSKIYNVTIVFNSNYGSGDIITIVDSNNKEIVSYKSTKSYNSLVVASPNLKKGENYIIKVNGTDYDKFTINNITTIVGNSGGMQSQGGNQGGRPGKNPGGNRR